jgi:hypothetical protein
MCQTAKSYNLQSSIGWKGEFGITKLEAPAMSVEHLIVYHIQKYPRENEQGQKNSLLLVQSVGIRLSST